MVRLNRRCNNALRISHLTSRFSYSLCIALRLSFVSGHFMCSARYGVGAVILLSGEHIFLSPPPAWGRCFFASRHARAELARRFSSVLIWSLAGWPQPWRFGFLPYLLPDSFFMLHTSKLAMRCNTRVLVLRFDIAFQKSNAQVVCLRGHTAFLAHHTFSVQKAIRVTKSSFYGFYNFKFNQLQFCSRILSCFVS